MRNKYKGDERFVRIHKRIEEENEHRERPIISKHEFEIAERLMQMKKALDDRLFLNINSLNNTDKFRQDIACTRRQKTLIDLSVHATLEERKFIRSLISDEYINQYQLMSEPTISYARV